jgi:hypothetical protein
MTTLIEQVRALLGDAPMGVPISLKIAGDEYHHRGNQGKVYASVSEWPRSADAMYPPSSLYRREVPSSHVYVSASKSAETIAKEVRRRLVEPMAPIYVELVERAAACDAYRKLTETTKARILANAYGASRANHSQDRVYVSDGPSLDISGESVRFEAFSVDIDTALAILHRMREARK